MAMCPGYPLVLKAGGKRCLVLGAGREAEEKALALTTCGALVERLESYQPGCLDGFFLAIAAGPDRSRNAEIFAEGERLGTLVNCVDDPDHCRFTLPSVLRRGELTVAISTGGACPALAVRLRERFQQELGPEYGEFLALAQQVRARLAAAVPDFAERRKLWYALVDSEALDLLRRGDRDAVRKLVEELAGPDALP